MGRAGRWMSTSGCDVFPSGRKREPCAVSPISEFRGNPNNGLVSNKVLTHRPVHKLFALTEGVLEK
jgi:hypothetical protein